MNSILQRDLLATQEIQGNLYQVVPSADFLAKPLNEDALGELVEHPFLAEHEDVQKAILGCRTVGDLLAVGAGMEEARGRLTFFMNWLLPQFFADEWMPDVSSGGGLRISDEETFGSEGPIVAVGRYATLSADDAREGQFVFTVCIRNYMRFVDAPTFGDVLKSYGFERDDLAVQKVKEWRRIRMPVYDVKMGSNLLAVGVSADVDLMEVKQFSLKVGKERFGNFLVRRGRMTADEWAKRVDAAQRKNRAEALRINMVTCTPYSRDKRYPYRFSDLKLVASTALIGAVGNNFDVMPVLMKQAMVNCQAANDHIRSGMASKERNFREVMDILEVAFAPAPQIIFTMDVFLPLKADKRKSMAGARGVRAYVPPENRTLIMLYPQVDTTDVVGQGRREKFLKNYMGKSSKLASLGFKFVEVPFDQDVAVDSPKSIVDDLIRNHGNAPMGVVVAWTSLRYAHRQLEFELMSRGIPVQHVIDVNNNKINPLKVASMMAGIQAKFCGCDPDGGFFFEDIIGKFDVAMGLDISRFDGQSWMSPAVGYTAKGMVVAMPKELDTRTQERRSPDELAEVIVALSTQARGLLQKDRIELLLIRDGFAHEDWENLEGKLPQWIGLTVVSVRKDLMTTFGSDFPQDTRFSIRSALSDKRGVFAVNAGMKKGNTINTVHLLTIIRNPLGVALQEFLQIMINLSRKNVTVESGICSLPMPQYYADRSAGELREFMKDRKLIGYLRRTRADEVNAEGGVEQFLYRCIKRYVTEVENGWSWAV
jgi:hypothetical protein